MVQTYFTDSASPAQYKGKLGAENAKRINSYENNTQIVESESLQEENTEDKPA